ncbi:MAG: hypothetical protein ACFCVH_11755 [Alphaproteobacteria bacterium]
MKRLMTILAVAAVGSMSLTSTASADHRRGDPVRMFFDMLFSGPPVWRIDPVPHLRYVSPFGDDDDDDGWSRHDDDDDDGWSRHDDDD